MNRQTPNYDDRDDDGDSSREVVPSAQTLALLARAEVDGQIATARAFPRKIGAFAREARELVTLDADTAESCIYSLPRGRGADKTIITGPSARFAEVLQYAFGNSRGGGRVVDVDGNFVVAQGVFHDLEKNVMTTMEVRRRITTSSGKRFNDDMITVTGNAAAAIAHRNAVLKAIPKPVWLPIYEAARMVALGDISTLSQRRGIALAWFAHKGVSEAQILAKLELAGVEDIGLDELEYLTGLKTAIRDGSLRAEDAFAPEPDAPSPAATGARNAADVAGEIRDRAKQQQGDAKPAADHEQRHHREEASSARRGARVEVAPGGAAAVVDGVAQYDHATDKVEARDGFEHPLADAMRATTKRDDLDALCDRASAEVEKGPLRTYLTTTLYNEQLARLERELGAL